MKWVSVKSFQPGDDSFFMWYNSQKKIIGLGIYKDGKYLMEGGKEIPADDMPTHILEGMEFPELPEEERELELVPPPKKEKRVNGYKR